MRTLRSEPSKCARSILAMCPQSVQKRNLRHNSVIITKAWRGGTQRLGEDRDTPIPSTYKHPPTPSLPAKGFSSFLPAPLLFLGQSQTYPFLGKTAMARGSSRLLLISTLRQDPSSLEASMVFRPVSVQYRFLATQSTANPSVVFSPRPITVSMLLPFRSARLEENPGMDKWPDCIQEHVPLLDFRDRDLVSNRTFQHSAQ